MSTGAAIVFGAGSGIGAAAAAQLAHGFDALVWAARDLDAAQRVADGIAAEHLRVEAVAADVRVPAEVQRAVEVAAGVPGGLRAACNSAGIEGPLAPAAQVDPAAWQAVMDVNLTGTWTCLQHEIRAMLQAGGGAVVNVASIYGLRGAQGGAAYAASKHGVVGLTRSTALEYARQGIRINAVCPGPSDTPMMRRLAAASPGLEGRTRAESPLRRWIPAPDVAAVIGWLCLPESAPINGQAIPVDDGITAG